MNTGDQRRDVPQAATYSHPLPFWHIHASQLIPPSSIYSANLKARRPGWVTHLRQQWPSW
ncbi:hypothetical protein KSC_092980 [Ktedonobacter sp. SOSP1-52]|nr:hypothetical protein KSC_092980 [Ktedonobacter sp. SOSP1-52]